MRVISDEDESAKFLKKNEVWLQGARFTDLITLERTECHGIDPKPVKEFFKSRFNCDISTPYTCWETTTGGVCIITNDLKFIWFYSDG